MQPDDWKAWLDMAVISAEMKQTNDMTMALENAVKAGGTQAATIISHDPRFQGFKAARK